MQSRVTFQWAAPCVAALLAAMALMQAAPALSQPAAIQLPKPQVSGGMPLMQVLNERKTTRTFADKPLPLQMLANLLWSGFGVNRPRTANPMLGRTAPSAWNKQEIELDVVLPNGVYVYEAEANRLRLVTAGDMRAKVSPGPAALAGVTIVFVADAKLDYAQVDTGFIGQNIYLFAASEGMSAWFYTVQTSETAAILKLPAERRALYVESVGYPAK